MSKTTPAINVSAPILTNDFVVSETVSLVDVSALKECFVLIIVELLVMGTKLQRVKREGISTFTKFHVIRIKPGR